METGYLLASDQKIFFRHWEPKEKNEIIIICIHGLAADSRIFTYFAQNMSNRGFTVYAIDLPGFGMSEGKKGDVSFDITMSTLHNIVTQIRNKHANLKTFMVGFSLGGLYALWYAASYQGAVDGVIALGPNLRIKGVKREPRAEPSKSMLFKAFLGYFLIPASKINLSRAIPTAFGKLAGDEWIHMMNDPICNFNYSYRYIFDVLISRAEKIDALYKLGLPVLIIHGNNDWIVVKEQSKEFFKRLNSADKELWTFDCDHWFYHTFFYLQRDRYLESERMSVINSIVDWIRKRAM